MVVYVIAGVVRDPNAARDQILSAVVPENPDLFMKVKKKIYILIFLVILNLILFIQIEKVLINCIAAAALASVLSFLLLLFTR